MTRVNAMRGGIVAVATVLDQTNASTVAKSDIDIPSACLVVQPEAASPLNDHAGGAA